MAEIDHDYVSSDMDDEPSERPKKPRVSEKVDQDQGTKRKRKTAPQAKKAKAPEPAAADTATKTKKSKEKAVAAAEVNSEPPKVSDEAFERATLNILKISVIREKLILDQITANATKAEFEFKIEQEKRIRAEEETKNTQLLIQLEEAKAKTRNTGHGYMPPPPQPSDRSAYNHHSSSRRPHAPSTPRMGYGLQTPTSSRMQPQHYEYNAQSEYAHPEYMHREYEGDRVQHEGHNLYVIQGNDERMMDERIGY